MKQVKKQGRTVGLITRIIAFLLAMVALVGIFYVSTGYKATENALAAVDQNVYFIPGPELLLDLVREEALVDNCHPADGGFISMAYVVGNKLKEILKK